MSNPQIILLNGTSSSGKSTIAKVLQARLQLPYLHVCIDSFEQMMPGRTEEGGEFAFIAVFEKLLSGFHHSIKALADCGNNLIVDHVLIEGEEPLFWIPEYVDVVTDFEIISVGVHCSVEELERRESQRGDRPIGLAAWQLQRMHKLVAYDVEVDTTNLSAEQCATRILYLLNPVLYK